MDHLDAKFDRIPNRFVKSSLEKVTPVIVDQVFTIDLTWFFASPREKLFMMLNFPGAQE